MATEYEELRLGVTLVDNVSSQLDKIKQSLASMGGGAQASGMERIKRQSAELSEGVKALATNFGTAGVTLTKFALSAGAAGAAVIGLGVTISRALTGLKQYADEMARLGTLSTQLGVGAAQLKSMSEQFAQSGVDAGKAQQNLAGLASAMADIGRANSQLRQTLLRGQSGDDRAAMEALLGDLGRVANNPAAFANKVREAMDNVYANVLERTKSSTRAAEARKNFASAFGMPDLAEFRGQFSEVSASQQQMWDARIRQAREFQAVTNTIGQSWASIQQSISAALLPAATAALQPIAGALKESAEQIAYAVELMRNFQPPAWMTAIGQGISDIGTSVSDALNKTNDAAARLGTQLREAIGNLQPPEWLAKLGNVLGGAAGAVGGAQAAVHGAGERTREAATAAWNKITGKSGAPSGIDAASAMQVPAFAEGGAIGAGELGVVGERGPELFKPGSSGTILPNAMYAAALAAEYGFGVKGASTLASGALSGTAGRGTIGQTLMGAIPGVGLLKKMKEDAESGHSLRTRLRAMLGLDDPGEPAPWQVSRRQGGGPVTSGANYMVGEGGPELFMGRGGSGGQGARLIGEQTRQMEELNQNTEGQNAQMRALTDELKILNTALIGGSTGGGGVGGLPGGSGTLGGSMSGGGASGGWSGGGGGVSMGGLGGLPGFGGAPSHGGTASVFAGGGGSSGGAGASGGWSGGGAATAPASGGAVPASERAGQAGAGSGKAAAEAYLGKSISNGEYDELMRATHAESGGKNAPEEQAMIMGSILNRARKNPAGIHGALNAPNQFQAVTGTRFAPGPSRAYRQGPNEARRGSIEGAAETLLHRVPTSQTDFTAASRAAYGPGTNVGYLDKMKQSGGAVYGGTQFRGHLAPEGSGGGVDSVGAAPSGGDSPHGGGVAAGGAKENESRVKELQSKVAGIRKLALKPELKTQLEAAAMAANVGVEVTSGGQHKHGQGPRTGSTRHDEGGAADLQLRDPKTGRLLDMRVEADQRRMAQFTQEAVASGATGVGAGLSYMGASTIHVGGGKPAAWGGIRGERAPGWLTGAHRAGLAEHEARLAGGGLDRKPLDADMGNEVSHKVEGTGHLSVDVSAPAGTKVAAEGGGLFKKTTVSRQTQMQPASEGPAVSV